jgi:hypothetical protein
MPENNRLLEILNDLSITPENKAQVFAGLEALTSASTFENDGMAFKQAVLAHQSALNGGTILFQGVVATTPNFLPQGGDSSQGNQGDNNCRALQSVAAFQRVVLALGDAPINDLAQLALMEDNDHLRTAIAAKRGIFGNLSSANFWNGGEHDEEVIEPLLSQEQLDQIRTRANERALEKIEAELVQYARIIENTRQAITDDIYRFDQIDDLSILKVKMEELKSSLEKMTKAQADYRALFQAHYDRLLNLQVNQAWRDQTRERLETQDTEVAALKRTMEAPLMRKITTLTDLIRGVNITGTDLTHLKPLVEKARAEFEVIEKAHALLVMANHLDVAEENLKRVAQNSLATLEFQYYKKISEDKKAALDAIIAELVTLADDDEKARREKLGEAEALLRAIEKAAKDASDLKNSIAGVLDPSREWERQIEEANKRVEEATEALEPFRIMYSPPRASLDYGNFFMEHVGAQHSEFTDKLVRSSVAAEVSAGGASRAPQGAVSIGALNDAEVYFERVKLEPGDKIKSTIEFPAVQLQGGRSSGGRKAELEQDDKGVVTNITPRTVPLRPDEQAKLALKQAEMLLTNYTPGSGKIVIRGGSDHVEEAKMVYAILLMLKDNPNRPELRDIEIESYVPGCKGPVVEGFKSKFQSEKAAMASATKAFIHDALHGFVNGEAIDFIAVKEVEAVRDRIGKFSAVKEARHSATDQMRKTLLSQKADATQRKATAEEIKDSALKAGDKIDLEGNVRQGPRH